MHLRLFVFLSMVLSPAAFATDPQEFDLRAGNRSPAVLPLPTDHPTDFGTSDLTLIREEDLIDGEPAEVNL
jgi:hypothetical protein